jgi:hypothetical protein
VSFGLWLSVGLSLVLTAGMLVLQAEPAGGGEVPGGEFVRAFGDLVSILRDAGLFGMALLFIIGLVFKKVVLGWTYEEVVKARDREKQRADALELLVARLTVATQRNTSVTEGLVMAQHGVGPPSSGGG